MASITFATGTVIPSTWLNDVNSVVYNGIFQYAGLQIANGVAYLNGSKVLTTGSALTYNGSQFTVQPSAPSATPTWLSADTAVLTQSANSILQLHVGTAGGVVGIGFSSGTTRNAGLIDFDTGNPATRFWINGSEQMRLTSTGLGIGTSSPSTKLDTTAANPANQLGGQLAVSSSTAYATGNVAGITFRANDSSASLSSYASIQMKTTGDNAGALTFITRSSAGVWDERMRLDSAGNLGVGTTSPNANTKIDSSGPIRAGGYTVATLPTGVVGARAYVTDAVTAVFMATPTGGGSVKTPVFFNGSVWVCG